jgi:C4-dicarboxylate-specific signal transduction histidine kinase
LGWLGTDQPDLARVRKAAKRIVRDGYRASAVLSSVRAVLKTSAPAMAELNLNEVIRDILDLMRNELNRYDVILQIDLCKQLGCIRGNRIQLQQVLINLVKNAIESMSDSVVRPLLVRVSTAIKGELAVVAVEDSGSGFDAAAAEHMFEPFFTTKREGTGVGLSICHSIVEAHGGVLCATRKDSPGSVFQFTVPLIHPPISIQS